MKHLLIDCGHGGIDPSTGLYTTIGEKQYHFKDKGIFVYEGDLNREFGKVFQEQVKIYNKIPSSELDIKCISVNHPYKDTSLDHRVDLANALAKVYDNCIYLSFHNNAASSSIKGTGSNAYGLEYFTSKGYTPSDVYAEAIYPYFDQYVRDRKIRKGKLGADKEANFYVLRWTKMPALLFEFGFFDNSDEIPIITSRKYQENCAKAIIDGILSVK